MATFVVTFWPFGAVKVIGVESKWYAKLRDEQIAKNTALRNRFVGAAMGGLYSGSSRQNEDENNYSK